MTTTEPTPTKRGLADRWKAWPLWARITSAFFALMIVVGGIGNAVSPKHAASPTTNPVSSTASASATKTPSSPATSPTPTATDYSNDPASLLASRDGATDIGPYAAALTAFAGHCREDRVTVAGYVDSAFTDEQKNHGPDTSRLIVARNLAKSVPANIGRTRCADVAAGYLVLVEQH